MMSSSLGSHVSSQSNEEKKIEARRSLGAAFKNFRKPYQPKEIPDKSKTSAVSANPWRSDVRSNPAILKHTVFQLASSYRPKGEEEIKARLGLGAAFKNFRKPYPPATGISDHSGAVQTLGIPYKILLNAIPVVFSILWVLTLPVLLLIFLSFIFGKFLKILLWLYRLGARVKLAASKLRATRELRLNGEDIRKEVVKSRFLHAHVNSDDQKYEFIFMLDISSSMSGTKLALAKQSLTLFLDSLPVTCYFNIVFFHSTFDLFFPISVKYTPDTLNRAKAVISDSFPGHGRGTDILRPLVHIYHNPQIRGYLSQIFVITAGKVSSQKDEDMITSLIKSNVKHSRTFALGIGGVEVSRSLVNGIAEAGGGTVEYVDNPQQLQSKILRQLNVALRPALPKPIRMYQSRFYNPSYTRTASAAVKTKGPVKTRSSKYSRIILLGFISFVLLLIIFV